MKHSKLQRKFVNQMRGMGEIPWPQRRFTYPPTFGSASSSEHVGQCPRAVLEVQVRHGRLRRKRTEQIKCGGNVFLRRGSLGRRRVYCEGCRARKEQRRMNLGIEQRMRRYGSLAPQEQIRDERRTARMLSRLKRGNR